MKPIIAGILISPEVSHRIITPPINANGRFNKITPLSFTSLNSLYSNMKITNNDIRDVNNNVRLAASSLSNWPPYSI